MSSTPRQGPDELCEVGRCLVCAGEVTLGLGGSETGAMRSAGFLDL